MKYNQNNILKSIVRGAGIIFFGTMFAYLTNFVYRLIISRYLGPADYGLIALGQMILNIGLIFAMFGLEEGIIRYVAYYKGQKKLAEVKGILYSALKISLPIAIIICVSLIFFSNIISNRLFNNPKFQLVLIVFSVILPLNVSLRLICSFFLALKKVEYSELILDIFRNISNLIFVFIVVILGGTIFHISISYLLATLFSFLIALFLLKYKIFPKIFVKKFKPFYDYKNLLSFSIPLLFTGIFLRVMGWADTFFLGIFKTASDVGIYNVAFPLAAAMGIFLISFGQIFYPLCSELLAKKKYFEIGKSFEVIIRWIFMITFPIFLLILFFPKDILNFLFGKEYIGGYIALVILISAYFINVITGPGIHTLKSFKKLKFVLNLNIIVVVLNVILNIILIPKYAINGAAIATAISIVLREIIIFLKVKSLIKFSYNIKNYLKYILSAIIPLIAVYLIMITFFRPYSIFKLVGALFVFSVLYLFFLLIFKSFDKEDLMIMLTIEKRLGLNLKFIKKIISKFI